MSSEMELTEKEYKKLSLNFRRAASRFLNTSHQNANDDLKRFLAFIEDSSVISDFIASHNIENYDMEKRIGQGERKSLKLPVGQSKEIAFIYQMLIYIRDHNIDYLNAALLYSMKKRLQDTVKEFNYEIVKPLIDHIESYLQEVAIDMDLDKSSNTQFNIHDFSGQLNHAEGQSTIHAKQTYNENDLKEVKQLASEFAQVLKEDNSVQENDKKEAVELVEAAVQEIESEKPRKSIIKSAMTSIRGINEIAVAGSNTADIGAKLAETFQGFLV